MHDVVGSVADSEDIDRADQDKVDTATTSLPTSTGIGTTAATSQDIVMFLLCSPCIHLMSFMGLYLLFCCSSAFYGN